MKDKLTIVFSILIVILGILCMCSCSASKKSSVDIRGVNTVKILSFGSGVQEHNNQRIDIEVDPGLATKELPKIDLSSAATLGWNSIIIKGASDVTIVRFFDNGQFNDFANVLDAFPLLFDYRDDFLYTSVP